MIIRRKYKDMYVLYNTETRQFFYFQDVAYSAFELYCQGKTDLEIIQSIFEEYDCDDYKTVQADCENLLAYFRCILGNTVSSDVLSDPDVTREEMVKDTTENDILDYATDNLIPFSCTWELVDSCNLKCFHCYCENSGHSIWNYENAQKLIDTLYSRGTMDLEITGGECLVNPDIFKILRYVQQKGFVITILTNAQVIDDTMATFLASLQPRNVQVSIYSYKDTVHDGITGVKGSLRKSLSAIELLKRKGVEVSIATPIMAENIYHLDTLSSWATDNDLVVNYAYKISPSLNKCKDPLKHSIFARADADEALLKIFKKTEYHTKLGTIIKDPRRVKEGDLHLCQAGFRNICITANGEVLPCNSLRYSFGNIMKDDFDDIWNGSLANKWRGITMSDYPKCLSCEARFYCEPCPAEHYNDTGKLFEIDKQSCWYGKALYHYAKELLEK